MNSLQIGNKAPDFTLPDQTGNQHQLSDYLGQWILIYFYPRDNTPGCTKEACTIRDNYSSFAKLDAVVLGISTDSIASHDKFASKHNLPFTLLADENREVVKAYEVWGTKKMMGKEFQGTKRMSFLINPKGKIAKVYKKVKPAEHAEQVLNDLNSFQY